MFTKKMLGEKIRNARKNCGLTQQQLGEKLGYKKTTICMWEHGNNEPKGTTVCMLQDILKVRF